MIKYAVGYQLPEGEDETLLDIVGQYKEHIGEVYFSWLDQPSGRSSLTNRRGLVNWQGQQHMEADLIALRQIGLGTAVKGFIA